MPSDRELSLPDGRTLAWSSTAPADGTPVLFLAGAATGRSMTFGSAHLAELGVRLVTVDRPGLGGSTHDPRRSAGSTAADLACLVARLGGAVPVVANSQAAVFGLALAERGDAARLLLVSPADEVADPRVFARLPASVRQVVTMVRDDPAAARALFAALGPEGLERMVVDGAGQADRAVYTDPAFLAAFRAALAEGFANDGAGYATDTVLAMTRWPLDWPSIRTPVEVWFGEADRTHSPDLGELLTSRIPGAVRRVVAGAGGALLWTHAKDVLVAALAGG
ncbi:alpha/beta fold hydrolase [Amycolatopsis thermophila]|uniref:Pimeloyl-ACP methyl ester carboxylesterase n=1 Tax=Amycolatopsis thermophila TaxID=206084 RepID=A0ABU0EWV5_9PSEU|nr:alpha/beta hydrolase [Amycolatopsis thermophila]MDQ0379804.1 pimeloyl-ACP methyl ester carboxylesterase [Amycolatopsis thermophila]